MTEPLFTPFATSVESLAVTPAVAERYGLAAWAENFALGTAGYRDLLDPDDFFSSEVPFNAVTVAIMLEARAQLALEHGLGRLHVGGEVRPHTQEFIDLAARLYAGHGLQVHLRPNGERTTPIWLSSFGVFHGELDGGENFTASHSQSYKGGWKPMDQGGGQLLEMAPLIAERVRVLAALAAREGLSLELAAGDDPCIVRDFDPVAPYTEVLRQVIPADLLEEVDRFHQKVTGGAHFTMTQPIYDAQLWLDFLNVYEHRHGEFPVPVLIGVLPLQGHRHASFLHNEVPGITLSEEALERMRKAGKQGRQEGVAMAQELLLKLKALPYVQGVYLMPSFGRYELACQVLDVLTPEERAGRA